MFMHFMELKMLIIQEIKKINKKNNYTKSDLKFPNLQKFHFNWEKKVQKWKEKIK